MDSFGVWKDLMPSIMFDPTGKSFKLDSPYGDELPSKVDHTFNVFNPLTPKLAKTGQYQICCGCS